MWWRCGADGGHGESLPLLADHFPSESRTHRGAARRRATAAPSSVTRPTCRPAALPPHHQGGDALVDVAELSRIALERCATALCATHMMGDLAVELGYYGADETQGEAGESMQVKAD